MRRKVSKRDRRRSRALKLGGAREAMWQMKIDSEEGLARYCQDTQQNVDDRYRACIVLGSVLGRHAIPLLLKLASVDDSGAVVGAVDALGSIQSRRATRTLIGIVKKSKNEAHRQAAIVALGRLEDRRAEKIISRVLLTEVCAQTKVYAVEALGAIHRGHRTVKVLMQVLADPSPSVRWSVLNVIGGIRDVNREELDEIRKYLSDESVVPGLFPSEEAPVAFAARRALNSWNRRLQ